jgi:hypothetical protein
LNEEKGAQRWLKLIQRVPLSKKPELLNNILKETEELIKILVMRIKTAEKKQKQAFKCDIGFFLFDFIIS